MSAPKILSVKRKREEELSRKEKYEQRTWDIMVPICRAENLTLVDVEFAKEGQDYNLCIYIDKEGGVGIEDCEHVSRLINPILDEEDFIDEAYTLIVSSPGLGRPLRRPHDFEFAMGKEIEIHTYKPVDKKKVFFGILTGWDEKTVEIREEDNTVRTFERTGISKIRLAFDF